MQRSSDSGRVNSQFEMAYQALWSAKAKGLLILKHTNKSFFHSTWKQLFGPNLGLGLSQQAGEAIDAYQAL